MVLQLWRSSSKRSIMPSVATRRSDTKVLSSLKRNTPGRWPIERHHACPPQGVHSKRRADLDMTCSSNVNGNQVYLSSSRVPARPLGVGVAARAEPHRIEVDASPSELTLASDDGGKRVLG